MEGKMPVYVKIDQYKGVAKLMDTIKSKLHQAKESLSKIKQIKQEEDAELDLWHTGLEEVERKLDFIDKSLLEPNM